MAITNGYLTLARFKDEYGIASTNTDRDEEIERAIEAASRAIDDHVGDKFWLDDPAKAVKFRLHPDDDPYVLFVPWIANTTGLKVETDDNADGTFETSWTLDDDFDLEPDLRPNSEPYERIVAIGTKTFPRSRRRKQIRVTAQWGWPSVPKAVEQACLLQAAKLVEVGGHTGGRVAAMDVEGGGAFPMQSKFLELSARLMLKPLRRVDVKAV